MADAQLRGKRGPSRRPRAPSKIGHQIQDGGLEKKLILDAGSANKETEFERGV